jgi:hypothetical protein
LGLLIEIFLTAFWAVIGSLARFLAGVSGGLRSFTFITLFCRKMFSPQSLFTFTSLVVAVIRSFSLAFCPLKL